MLCGGADSYLDLMLLSELSREQRLLGPDVADGFIPGEGAAFLLLSSVRAAGDGGGPAVAIRGVGTARDAGHRYSAEPARGEGLSLAMEALLATLPEPPAARLETTLAGFNGESFQAKEWGVARCTRRSVRARRAHRAPRGLLR